LWNPFKKKTLGLDLTFLPSGKRVTILSGSTVLEAALAHDVDLNHACDGNLACSSCHVYIESGAESTNPMAADEDDMLDSADEVKSNSRLACQLRVYADMVVRIPLG